MKTDAVVQDINHWIDALVVGLNLCPFANAARRKNLVKIKVCTESSVEDCLQMLVDEANKLEQTDEDATTLLILSDGFVEFDDYLDLLALAEALLDDRGFEGILQLASFHPNYQFEGAAIDDVSNWTNRAPYPVLHLLKEASVSKAVESHPDPDNIPGRNIDTLENLGLPALLEMLRH
ncbi:MAG: hypothetical protein ACI8VW_001263 [bacterium]